MNAVCFLSGGFVPKNPPILDGFYENAYLTTAPDVNAVTPQSLNGANTIDRKLFNIHKCARCYLLYNFSFFITTLGNCISSGLEVHHGQSVPSNTPCVTCLCLYGTIVCHQIECPPVESGCKITNLQEQTCCPQYVCGESSKVKKNTLIEHVTSQFPTPVNKMSAIAATWVYFVLPLVCLEMQMRNVILVGNNIDLCCIVYVRPNTNFRVRFSMCYNRNATKSCLLYFKSIPKL